MKEQTGKLRTGTFCGAARVEFPGVENEFDPVQEATNRNRRGQKI
jgi:hypothetical protein